ncbi:hypothetical protein B0H63DRAFT_516647 [Podospora didyma]|uniref:Uncharacterized protein n=1 Tax=Podospora didyma TaxID=330526 RepID=A0AAE0U752_9PEZI|nr:hypothetical protein B0H63DRAFT_516647 [Podospora didyma]
MALASPLPAPIPVHATAQEDEAKPVMCSNWLPTVISGWTDDIVTIAVCAPEPTALSEANQKINLLDDPPSSSTTTTTVTVTVTATTSLITAPAPVSDVTVQRTFTVTAWTKTVTLIENINCTRTVLAPSTPAAPPVRTTPTASLFRRQTGSTTSTPAPPFPTSNTTTTAAAPGRPARTRTVWTVTTATQTGDLVRTQYQCSATVAYLFTVDKTATISYTNTIWPSSAIVTSTLSVACNPFGFGVPTSFQLPPPRPLPTSIASNSSVQASLIPGPTPIPSTRRMVLKRQTTGTTTAATSTPAVVVPPVPGSTTVAVPVTSTLTVHLTRTIYSLLTVTGTGLTTRLTYACAATSTSVVIPGPTVPVPTTTTTAALVTSTTASPVAATP